MISSRWVFWYPRTPINHPQRYLPNVFKCIVNVSITTHVGGFWHTGHDIMFSPRSVLYYPCIRVNHPQRYFQHMFTCVIDVCITTHIGGFPPDTVSTFNSHSIQINAKSDFDSLDTVLTTPVVLVQFHVVSSTWCRPGAQSYIWSHPGWNTHHGKVELAT